jgi:uncharacterized protein GlcG (DUF336 family)
VLCGRYVVQDEHVRTVFEADDDEADAMVAAAIAAARAIGIRVSVAVVDRGGRLKRFARMDGAEVAGTTLAQHKAFSALANSCSTEELASDAQPGGSLYGIASSGAGEFTIVGGGAVVTRDGDVLAGIGVSGGTAGQDRECAEAAVAVMSD